jgi:hypothetical protein
MICWAWVSKSMTALAAFLSVRSSFSVATAMMRGNFFCGLGLTGAGSGSGSGSATTTGFGPAPDALDFGSGSFADVDVFLRRGLVFGAGADSRELAAMRACNFATARRPFCSATCLCRAEASCLARITTARTNPENCTPVPSAAADSSNKSENRTPLPPPHPANKAATVSVTTSERKIFKMDPAE